MIYFLLGPDDYTKKIFIDNLASQTGSEVLFYAENDTVPASAELTQPSLFGVPKLPVFREVFSVLDWPEQDWGKLAESKEPVIFVESGLDQRTKKFKFLKSNKKIKFEYFELPSGEELNKWLLARTEALGARIEPRAANLLALQLGRDLTQETKIAGKVVARKEVFNLWQADNEVKKLISAAGGAEITEELVKGLGHENMETDVFQITNAAAEGKKEQVEVLLENFFSGSTDSGEKGKAIQLAALLAEQFRNVLMVQDFQDQGARESEILQLTKWKPGRLFVISKMAKKIESRKVKDFLAKLEALDTELKTGDVPPKVLLDLILAQF